MRQAKVLYKDQYAGLLSQLDDGSFRFEYKPGWLEDPTKPPVSLTLPKKKEPFLSEFLFPFFYHMLPEGTNKQVVCYNLRIDEHDHFGILLATSKVDTVGAVRLDKLEE